MYKVEAIILYAVVYHKSWLFQKHDLGWTCGWGPRTSYRGCWLGQLGSWEVLQWMETGCIKRERGTLGPRLGIFIMEGETHQLHAWGALERAGEGCHWEWGKEWLFIYLN